MCQAGGWGGDAEGGKAWLRVEVGVPSWPGLKPSSSCSAHLLSPFCCQLHEKFEHLKRVHQEEKRKVEEKRRELEEETNAFNRRKAAVEALQSQALHATSQQPLRKDKDKKK